MTALVLLGLVALATASGAVGWMVATRRHRGTETALRAELASARTNAEESHRRHEAIVGEVTRTALQAIRGQGGESS